MSRKTLKKLLLVLLVVFTAAGANAQNERISLRSQNATVGELIRTIENQTSFRFSYNRNKFDISRRLAMPAQTMTLRAILNEIVSGTGDQYVIGDRFIAFVKASEHTRPQVLYGRSGAYVASKNSSSGSAPAIESATSAPLAVVVDEPDKPHFSNYTPIDIYPDVQRALPRFAFKTNLLYWATTTPNIAFEFGMARRWTMELAYSNNPWNYRKADGWKLLHGIARIEARYWFCERFSGHFLGLHALYSEYNINAVNVPLLFDKNHRYHGNAWGGGLVYGYDVPIGKRWNIEFTVGVGVYRMRYDRYTCVTCDRNGERFNKTWVGPSRLGVTLMFLLK